jgi:hypothetical protein
MLSCEKKQSIVMLSSLLDALCKKDNYADISTSNATNWKSSKVLQGPLVFIIFRTLLNIIIRVLCN